MERYRGFVEEGMIFMIMSIFTVLKQMLREGDDVDWKKSLIKVFTNLVAGWGFYSFLLAYKPWYGEYPQKIGVIMVMVYAGSKLIDIVVDAVYKFDFKEIIKRWMGL